ncbi:hypothetical protein B7P43_G09801, partial [Cryptotermes secundus]
GGDVLQETITANVSEDSVTLEFQRSDGTLITQLVDFRNNFHLFGPLKHHLSAEHFPDDEAVEREVTAWFREQPKEFYAACFQGLVKRWGKCLNVQGDYVEN